MRNILFLEDDAAISHLVAITLRTAGYDVTLCETIDKAKEELEKSRFSLALLDVNLPDGSSFELIPTFQKRDIPVICLTARTNITDKVEGLNLGASDYITKPFETIELLARIKAVLRHYEEQEEYQFDNVKVDLHTRIVSLDGSEVNLTRKEYELLIYLLEHPNQALSREHILEKVWGWNFEGSTRTIDMHVKNLRTKLDTQRIETVFKHGYRLVMN